MKVTIVLQHEASHFGRMAFPMDRSLPSSRTTPTSVAETDPRDLPGESTSARTEESANKRALTEDAGEVDQPKRDSFQRHDGENTSGDLENSASNLLGGMLVLIAGATILFEIPYPAHEPEYHLIYFLEDWPIAAWFVLAGGIMLLLSRVISRLGTIFS